jgi:hypothetical protein
MRTIYGDVSAWQENLYAVQDIMLEFLVPEAWPACRAKCAGQKMRENAVTGCFVKELRVAKRNLKKKHFEHTNFHIHPATQVNPGENDTGYPDIYVTPWEDDEEIYVAYECKWLETSTNDIGEFCGNEGIGRFVHGKYASHVPTGNMIGYVFADDVKNAENKICNYMKKHALPIPVAHAVQRNGMRVLRSTHQRAGNFGEIELTHILLPYLDTPELSPKGQGGAAPGNR